MGVPVLVLGESGTGKSASLRNFEADDLKVINVANKPLPFKNKFESVSTDDYREVVKELKTTKKKVVVIDDAQYLMANEFMRRATERGYDKFTEIAQNFWSLVNAVKDLPQDAIVYFLAHIERDQNGNEKIKTIGKLLDEKITVEGMFTIVLKTNVTDGVYSFVTQNNGHDTVKSPIGMFPSYAIDNDLKYVDEKIRNYYELGEFLSDEELAEIDEAAKKDDIPIKEEKKKRGKKKEEKLKETPSKETEEEAADEKPDYNRRRSGTRKTEEVKEDEELPKRKPRSKAEPDVEPKETEESKDADKPVRRRRTKTTNTDESTEAAEVQGTEETSEAPVRRRRRKVES